MNYKFFAAVFAVVIVAVAVFLWNKFREETMPARQELEFQNKDSASNSVKVVGDQEISAGVVEYKNGIFTPSVIKIDKSMGCILGVINASNKVLKLGLSPHAEKGDTGFSYTETPPGETILVDPRYRIDKIAFHDHNHPGSELQVQLEGTCKDF